MLPLKTCALNHRLKIATLFCLAILATSCGPSSQSQPVGQEGPGPELAVTANGWEKISMVANWAKTSLDPTGHFLTSRNACGRPADGAIVLHDWNKLTHAINQALTLPRLAENKCVEIQQPTKMDGLAEIQLNEQESSKIELIDARGYQICSKIPDPELVTAIYKGLSAVVETADKEECTNGWGSG